MNEQHILERAFKITASKIIRHPRLKHAKEGAVHVKFDLTVEFWLRDKDNPREAPVWNRNLYITGLTAFRSPRTDEIRIRSTRGVGIQNVADIIGDMCKKNKVMQEAFGLTPTGKAERCSTN